MRPRHVTVIGVGLLGGSAGLAAKAAFGCRVAGVGRRAGSLQEAFDRHVIDSAHLEAGEAVGHSDLVILATPVGAFAKHLRAIGPHLKAGAIVTDVGSTKSEVVRVGERILGRGGPFVGSHPMAGNERKGAAHARADLFAGETCIITPTANTPAGHIKAVEEFWRALGMATTTMTPATHDRLIARVSHLPHALSCLLMLLPPQNALAAAGPGFKDMTRLAGGDWEMWRDIFLTNRRQMLVAIDDFDESLMHLRDLVELRDGEGLEKFLLAAKTRREGWLSGGPK
jgi:prephenate dehydrogenase